MLVLSRQPGQTVMIGEEIQLTVLAVSENKADLRITGPERLFLTLPTHEQPRRGDELHVTLTCGRTLRLAEVIEITVVDIRQDKARIGLNAPAHLPIHRKEVWEAIRREIAGGELGSHGSPASHTRLRVIRQPGQGFVVGDRIRAMVLQVIEDDVRLGIETPDGACLDFTAEERRRVGKTFKVTMRAGSRRSIARGVMLSIGSVTAGQVELEIEAPETLPIYRTETWDRLHGG